MSIGVLQSVGLASRRRERFQIGVPGGLLARVRPLLNVSLLGLLATSFVTGWLASLLGLTEFGLHKYTSIAFVILGGLHVAMHLRTLRFQLRRRRTSASLDKLRPHGIQPRSPAYTSAPEPLALVDDTSARVLRDWLRQHPQVSATCVEVRPGSTSVELIGRVDAAPFEAESQHH